MPPPSLPTFVGDDDATTVASSVSSVPTAAPSTSSSLPIIPPSISQSQNVPPSQPAVPSIGAFPRPLNMQSPPMMGAFPPHFPVPNPAAMQGMFPPPFGMKMPMAAPMNIPPPGPNFGFPPNQQGQMKMTNNFNPMSFPPQYFQQFQASQQPPPSGSKQ